MSRIAARAARAVTIKISFVDLPEFSLSVYHLSCFDQKRKKQEKEEKIVEY